ncbi:MAG: F0F1 ATP synthase subunit B [Bacteroidota bacterium]
MLTPELGLIFWQIVVFGVLFFLLSKFAWKPIIASLKERDQSIDDALQMAAKTRQEMAELKSGNEKLVAEAKAIRDGIIKDAKATADNMIVEAKTAAVEAARVENEKARVAFENEKLSAIALLRKEAALLTINIAEKVLRKELADKNAQEKLVSEFISDAKLN